MDPSLYTAAMNGDLTYLQNLGGTASNNLQFQLTPCQETVLHVATEFHQMEFAKDAVWVCPALLSLANSSGDTALHIAAKEEHENMVKFFISYGRSSNIETGEYEPLTRMVNLKNEMALHCAARRGNQKCVELLVKADPEVCSFVNDADESPLYLSVASGYWTQPKMIINYCRSFSASHKGPNGLTALHAAVLQKYYPFEEIKLLVEWRKEMIREADNLGMTPLHYAAFYGRIGAIKLFLENDSSAIYLLNNDGQSALHVAAFNGKVEALKELVNCRPDCYNMVDNKGRTALHAAVLGDQHAVVEFVFQTPMLQGLIDKADKDGNTPLHLAAYFKLYKIIKIFSRNWTMRYFKILNDKFSTPFDVYYKQFAKQDMQQLEVECYTTISSWEACYRLRLVKGIIAIHQYANTKLKMMNMEPTNAREETFSTNKLNKAERRRGDFGEETALEVNLLVAMLVATVTFAAGFTVPGGFVDKGEDEGLASLTNKPAFKAFVVFNTMAFCCSIYAVLVHFATSLKYHEARVYYKEIAASFTAIAILAMVLAFCCGTYAVLTKSTALSLVSYIILASVSLLYPISRWLNTWIKVMELGEDLKEVPSTLRPRLFMDIRSMRRNKMKMVAGTDLFED